METNKNSRHALWAAVLPFVYFNFIKKERKSWQSQDRFFILWHHPWIICDQHNVRYNRDTKRHSNVQHNPVWHLQNVVIFKKNFSFFYATWPLWVFWQICKKNNMLQNNNNKTWNSKLTLHKTPTKLTLLSVFKPWRVHLVSKLKENVPEYIFNWRGTLVLKIDDQSLLFVKPGELYHPHNKKTTRRTQTWIRVFTLHHNVFFPSTEHFNSTGSVTDLTALLVAAQRLSRCVYRSSLIRSSVTFCRQHENLLSLNNLQKCIKNIDFFAFVLKWKAAKKG